MPSPDRTSERSGAEPSRAPPARAAPKAKERGEASRAPAMPPAQLAELLDREKGEGAARPPAEVAADLQSGFGNRYTQDVLAARARSRVPGRPPPAAAPAPGVQRAVAIGSADDRLEREAEQVASRVATGQAVPQASIVEAFVRIGLTVDGGVSWLLPRLIGTARALELFYTGDPLTAGEALQRGVLNRVVEPEQLEPAVRDLAERLAAGPSLALAAIKRSVDHAMSATFEDAVDFEFQLQAVQMRGEDFREGVTAFLEKRPPRFQRG